MAFIITLQLHMQLIQFIYFIAYLVTYSVIIKYAIK